MVGKTYSAVINYIDPKIALGEFGGLVALAKSHGVLDLPATSNGGVLRFPYDSRQKALDFYHAALDDRHFHFNSGEIAEVK